MVFNNYNYLTVTSFVHKFLSLYTGLFNDYLEGVYVKSTDVWKELLKTTVWITEFIRNRRLLYFQPVDLNNEENQRLGHNNNNDMINNEDIDPNYRQ